MAKYLYAAAVQGIQSFIFQTNVLKDIVGASELVDSVCTEAFKTCLFKHGIHLFSQASLGQCHVKHRFQGRPCRT